MDYGFGGFNLIDLSFCFLINFFLILLFNIKLIEN